MNCSKGCDRLTKTYIQKERGGKKNCFRGYKRRSKSSYLYV